MNAIAMSLYGGQRKYADGAIRNAELAPIVYPGWRLFIYHDRSVSGSILSELKALGVLLVENANRVFPAGLFWRFFIAGHPQVERFIIRDADSRLNFRERRAVDAWIKSGKDFHVMRDHPHHRVPICAGMWGAVRSQASHIPQRIQSWTDTSNSYSSDQTFLERVLWPKAGKGCLQHDSCTREHFPGSIPFPDGCRAGDYRFVGERFDENDKPTDEWQTRLNYMT